jgi:hypothetical protein
VAQQPRTLTHEQVAALAESVGLPGEAFAQIAQGESGYQVGAVGHDPGGTQGLGLWQITTHYNDDIIRKFGGRQKLLTDPYANALAAKAIYDRQGIKAWYGTKYLTDPKAHYKGDTSQWQGAAPGRTESPAGGLSAAPAAPAIIDGGQAGDFTSLLATLGQKPQTAAPVSSALPASPLAPKVALPQGFQGQQATPQEQAPSAQSGLLEALRGADPTNGSSGQSGASAADSVLSVMERVAAARSPKPAPELAAAAPEQTAATIKAGAEGGLDGIVAEMDRIDAAKVPYLWGGGHQKKAKPGAKVTPLDCSGAVSQALGIDPRVSGQFESWGKAGRGKLVTIYANDTHVLMHVKGRGFWGTSKSNPGGGAGWIDDGQVSSAYLSRFTARHPRGL